MDTTNKSFIGILKTVYENHKEFVLMMLAVLVILFLGGLIISNKLYALMLAVVGISFIIAASGYLMPDGKSNPILYCIAFACNVGAYILYNGLNRMENELAS